MFLKQHNGGRRRIIVSWHRFYDPDTGRYISADPIGLDGGMNLYAYVGGNPVNALDPEGLCPNNQCDKWEISIVVVGSATTDKPFPKKWKLKGGIAGLEIKAQLKADDDCCMDVKEREYYYQGLGLGVGADIGGSVDEGGGKCFETACIEWEAHEGFGRTTSAGGGVGRFYGSTLWITTPQTYLNFTGWGKGFGLSGETTLGYWSLGKDISAK